MSDFLETFSTPTDSLQKFISKDTAERTLLSFNEVNLKIQSSHKVSWFLNDSSGSWSFKLKWKAFKA